MNFEELIKPSVSDWDFLASLQVDFKVPDYAAPYSDEDTFYCSDPCDMLNITKYSKNLRLIKYVTDVRQNKLKNTLEEHKIIFNRKDWNNFYHTLLNYCWELTKGKNLDIGMQERERVRDFLSLPNDPSKEVIDSSVMQNIRKLLCYAYNEFIASKTTSLDVEDYLKPKGLTFGGFSKLEDYCSWYESTGLSCLYVLSDFGIDISDLELKLIEESEEDNEKAKKQCLDAINERMVQKTDSIYDEVSRIHRETSRELETCFSQVSITNFRLSGVRDEEEIVSLFQQEYFFHHGLYPFVVVRLPREFMPETKLGRIYERVLTEKDAKLVYRALKIYPPNKKIESKR